MDALRIVSLGGFNSVTENMYVYHFLPNGKEENDQILIVDCGVGFPEEEFFGIDLVIPDTSYLDDRKDKIVGLILTHGHEDHIGGLPFILPDLPKQIGVFASRLTAALAQEKLDQAGITRKINIFSMNDVIKIGKFTISPVRVTHSLPDTYHFYIETPAGNFYHGSDFKFDLIPPDGIAPQLSKIAEIGKKGIDVLLSDCLGSEKKGYSPSETILNDLFENEIRGAKGRVFITAISSNIYRWQRAIEASKKFNRKIALVGFSIAKMIKISEELGLIRLNKDDLVDYRKALSLPDNKVTFLIAGSLGQTGSSLERVVLGKHKIKIKEKDKVIFSSPDYIPGTTKAIYQLIDELIAQGAEVVYRESADDEALHVSGHGYQQELSLLIQLINPRFLIPIGGETRYAFHYSMLAEKMGFKPDQIILPRDEAMPTFWTNGKMDMNFKCKTKQVLIDGLGIGDVGKAVLRDRGVLSKNGMVVLIVLVDTKNNRLAQEVEVVSRGFVYMKENKKLLSRIKQQVKKVYEAESQPKFNINYLRFKIQAAVEEFIVKETGREPMVLPVILKI